MKIAHIIFGLTMGGIETMIVNITRWQANYGNDVSLIVVNDMIDPSLEKAVDPRVRLYKIGRRPGSRNPWPLIKLNLLIRRLSPDVIHLHRSNLMDYIWTPGLDDRICFTLHDMYSPSIAKGLDKRHPVFSISEAVRADLEKHTGIEAVTVCNGIVPEEVAVRTSTEAHKPFRIVQVGRLEHDKKGQDVLIRALAALDSEGLDLRLSFIGDGSSRGFLEDLARELGVSEKVEFLGNCPQSYVLQHLRDYDLYVHPSRFEGFGLTVAEAMAARVPVLVSDNDGPMEVIAGGQYGFYFPIDDVAECARMIKEIMRNYPDREWLNKARERVERCFNVSETARRYVDLYRDRLGVK